MLSESLPVSMMPGNTFLLAEQDPQTFWTLAANGLVRIRLSGDKKLKARTTEFAPFFPSGRARSMFIDRQQGLWIVCDLGLLRFELPPADKQ